MAKASRGLGRGLGALIPSGELPEKPAKTASTRTSADTVPVVEPAGATYAEIPIAKVTPNPQQPRSVFDEEALAELVHSIRTIGLLQPIVVRPTSRTGEYELIAGERRLRASGQAGLTTIPAIIRHTDDADMLRDALLENLHRANLNALEEAAAYSQMLSDFGCTQEELAQRIGRSRPQITNTIRLLKLPASVQNKVAAGVLSAGHARALLSLSEEAAQEKLAQRIIAEGLSVRSVEEIILLGDADGTTREKKNRKRSSRDTATEIVVADLVERSANALETRVHTKGFASANARGQLIIDCADVEDLRRIVDLLD